VGIDLARMCRRREFVTAVDTLAKQRRGADRGSHARKQAIYEGWGRTYEQQLGVERDLQRELGHSASMRKASPRSLPSARTRFSGR
jgi:hypothetical protein